MKEVYADVVVSEREEGGLAFCREMILQLSGCRIIIWMRKFCFSKRWIVLLPLS